MSNILLGVTGGIACYKAVYLLRLLKKSGHVVRVIMTKDATRFVGPLTFETLSESPVYIESTRGVPIDHIDLANWADVFLIAPASANTIAKTAHGLADNLLTAALLAAKADIIMVYPAMNEAMYMNPATQDNIKTLISRGFYVAKPAVGELACVESGIGRLTEPEDILEQVGLYLALGRITPVLAGKRILVTAGPTVEEIDAVRYISNYSSGKMGLALAEAAQTLGGEVELICGAPSVKSRVNRAIYTKSAEDMRKAVLERVADTDILIMNAAVADYTPVYPDKGKIKKTPSMNLELVKTADILKEAAELKRSGQFFAGFAAESENSEENALIKLREKKVDLIALNDISNPAIGFNSDYNEVTAFFADGEKALFAKQPKRILAYRLLIKIAEKLKNE
jgi:phosphopantothenoylcysteine decarboxylase/phosphopantothenate--cysteine ligase